MKEIILRNARALGMDYIDEEMANSIAIYNQTVCARTIDEHHSKGIYEVVLADGCLIGFVNK